MAGKKSKRFAIINAGNLLVRNFFSMEEAITWSQNYLDHSGEIIVREIKWLDLSFRTKL